MPSRPRPSRPGSRASKISIAATMPASATSTSTSATVCGSAPPRPSSSRCVHAPISPCGFARRPNVSGSISTRGAALQWRDAAAGRRAARGSRRARGHSLGRGDRHPAAAATVGRWPGGAAARTRHSAGPRARRRRRQPAGSPADSPGVQGAGCAHAQRGRLEPVGPAGHRPRICAAAHRSDEHGPLAARRLREERPRAGARQPAIPRATA